MSTTAAITPMQSRVNKQGLSPARRYWQYRHSAERRAIDWQLTKEQVYVLFAGNCHYCDTPPNTRYNRAGCVQTFVYNGIDRVDNSKGYTIDNVVSCCKHCNFAKSEMSVDEFKEWIQRVTKRIDLF